jgi:hypothetical protein
MNRVSRSSGESSTQHIRKHSFDIESVQQNIPVSFPVSTISMPGADGCVLLLLRQVLLGDPEIQSMLMILSVSSSLGFTSRRVCGTRYR